MDGDATAMKVKVNLPKCFGIGKRFENKVKVIIKPKFITDECYRFISIGVIDNFGDYCVVWYLITDVLKKDTTKDIIKFIEDIQCVDIKWTKPDIDVCPSDVYRATFIDRDLVKNKFDSKIKKLKLRKIMEALTL